MAPDRPRVLLVNDDGPPGAESPYIFGLYQYITNHLKWDVRVVIPSSQKSWIGKAYHVKEVARGRYFYPRGPDGLEGETSDTPRPLREGEIAEWILLDGTPATCTNVALHNLYPGEIDLVLSGPNYGRNTSTAFSLSSGTVGGAMSAALARTRAIAISYGNVLYPTPPALYAPAHELTVKIVQHLWTNWGKAPDGVRDTDVDLYNVNLPMIHALADPGGLRVYWTRMWRNSYGRLFEPVPVVDGTDNVAAGTTTGSLAFKWAPDIESLVRPDLNAVPVGTDGWAFANGHASITPLKCGFAEVDAGVEGDHPLQAAL